MKAIDIENRILNGETLFISTAVRTIKVDKKCVLRWRKNGNTLFKSASQNNFYIARGSHFDYICNDSESILVQFIGNLKIDTEVIIKPVKKIKKGLHHKIGYITQNHGGNHYQVEIFGKLFGFNRDDFALTT